MKRTIRRRLEREKQKIITRLAPLIGGKEPKAGALNSGSPGVVAASGLRGDEWEELQRVIDVQNVQKWDSVLSDFRRHASKHMSSSVERVIGTLTLPCVEKSKEPLKRSFSAILYSCLTQ